MLTGRLTSRMRLSFGSERMVAVPEMRFFSLNRGIRLPRSGGTMTVPLGPGGEMGAPVGPTPSILLRRSATLSESARLSCTHALATCAGGTSMSSLSAMSWRTTLAFSVTTTAWADCAGT